MSRTISSYQHDVYLLSEATNLDFQMGSPDNEISVISETPVLPVVMLLDLKYLWNFNMSLDFFLVNCPSEYPSSSLSLKSN
jgi:hypothetical protein